MKKKNHYLLGCFLLMCCYNLFAQAPESFQYQAIARDNVGNSLNNQTITIQVGILQDSTTGGVVYLETHNITTNAFGLFKLDLGRGSLILGNFPSIDWGANKHFVQLEMDPAGGSNFQLMGVSQLLSVPYAMYAKKSGTAGPQGPTGPTGATGPAGSSVWMKVGNHIYTTADSVGIGTASPMTRLEVAGTISGNASTLSSVYADSIRGRMAADTNDILRWNGTVWQTIHEPRVAFRANSIDQMVEPYLFNGYDTLDASITTGTGFEDCNNCFNNNQRVFYVPKTGVYFFEASATWTSVTDGEYCSIFITVNNSEVSGGFSTSPDGDIFTETSTTLKLNEGDRVYVRIYNFDTITQNIYAGPGGILSSFSGYQIY